jgi:hypothetical protein
MRLILLILALILPTSSRASDVHVSYTVNEKALKAQLTPATQLTFTLYSDNACTQQLDQTEVNAGTVELISRLKLLTPKGGVKTPSTDQIETTLTGVPPFSGTLYLTVAGTGVTPVGPACQAQASQALSGEPYTATIAFGGNSWLITSSSLPNNVNGYPLVAVSGPADVVLSGLDTSQVYDCTLGGSHAPSGADLPVYDIHGCTAHAPSCTDNIKNQNETAVDCGGVCPPCGDLSSCNVNADCQSSHCQPTNDACTSGFKACTPATCSDSIQNNGESGVDCGAICEFGCATGVSCSSTCDCQTGHACTGPGSTCN